MQRIHLQMKLLLLLSLAFVLAASGVTRAVERPRVFKYETVYTTLKRDGRPADVSVVDWLRVYGTGTMEVLDPARLTDVKNLRGPEKPTLSSKGILWKFTANGCKDIQYSGRTNLPLPLELHVSYRLNGKPMRAEEIVGKSGRVDVVIKLINKLGPFKPVTGGPGVYTPVTINVSTEIPLESNTDVHSETAMSTLVGSRMRFAWLVFPDPLTEIDFSFTSKKIKFSSVDAVVIPRMPPLTGISFAAQLVPLQDGLETIDASLGETISGAHQLSAGQRQLHAGLVQLSKGLTDILTLAKAHQQILQEMDRSIEPFNDQALNEMSTAFKQLNDGVTASYEGVGQLKQLNQAHLEIARQLKQGLDAIDADEVSKIPGAVAQMNDGLNQVESNLRLLAMANDGQAQVVQQLHEANVKALDSLQSFEKKNKALIFSKEYQDMKKSLKMQIEVLETLVNGGKIEKQRIPGLKETASGATKLADGVHEILTGVGSMNAVTDGYATQFEEMKKAVDVLAKGGTIQGRDVPGLDTSAKGLESLHSGLGTMLQALKGFMGKVGEILKLGELRKAVGVLLRGGKIQNQDVPGIDTATKGLSSSLDGTETSVSGAKQLADGQVELAEGLGRLRTEGIVPIRTAVKEGVEALARQDASIGLMLRKVKGYDSFTGKPAGATGEVRFLYRIPALEP